MVFIPFSNRAYAFETTYTYDSSGNKIYRTKLDTSDLIPRIDSSYYFYKNDLLVESYSISPNNDWYDFKTIYTYSADNSHRVDSVYRKGQLIRIEKYWFNDNGQEIQFEFDYLGAEQTFIGKHEFDENGNEIVYRVYYNGVESQKDNYYTYNFESGLIEKVVNSEFTLVYEYEY